MADPLLNAVDALSRQQDEAGMVRIPVATLTALTDRVRAAEAQPNKPTPSYRVGQRVKFTDPDTFDARIGQGLEVRGRITHFEGFLIHGGGIDYLYQVIQDGKALALWLSANEIQGE